MQLNIEQPPGNGKTASLKAIMREIGVPSLYVKSFACENQLFGCNDSC